MRCTASRSAACRQMHTFPAVVEGVELWPKNKFYSKWFLFLCSVHRRMFPSPDGPPSPNDRNTAQSKGWLVHKDNLLLLWPKKAVFHSSKVSLWELYSVVIHVSALPQHYQKSFLFYTGHLSRKVSHSLDKSINVDLGFLPLWHMPFATILFYMKNQSLDTGGSFSLFYPGRYPRTTMQHVELTWCCITEITGHMYIVWQFQWHRFHRPFTRGFMFHCAHIHW